ncbi:RNA polymerase sigma-70 factor [Nonomuraea sp. NBC_01738]|uniref:RNA polymerase sigma-70 factor n=1 Tax=Nonomuraea sp. NBC_01738 TaxID=2976003 RepID=UPI002E12E4C3|nr:RNA polymerase sigma-70 factor [Nonomuraea sp. NBC_01738]
MTVFDDHRNLLFSVAYRMLGSAADAEDVVQDTWLKWSAVDQAAVAEPRAYLVKIATNLSVDRLRSATARRETYVGPWLPEPILTSPDVADDAELAESVSMAMLVVLETLTPLERAVFVLKEVFGYSFVEIAGVLGRSEASVRQLGHRSREHVQARRPRLRTDPAERREATRKFYAAAIGGDLNELMEILAPDVTLWTDGGGKVRQAFRPLSGAKKVAAWLAGVTKRPYEGVPIADMVPEFAEVNGGPALLISVGDRVLGVFVVDLGDDGRVNAVHAIANPDKLREIAEGRAREV